MSPPSRRPDNVPPTSRCLATAQKTNRQCEHLGRYAAFEGNPSELTRCWQHIKSPEHPRAMTEANRDHLKVSTETIQVTTRGAASTQVHLNDTATTEQIRLAVSNDVNFKLQAATVARHQVVLDKHGIMLDNHRERIDMQDTRTKDLNTKLARLQVQVDGQSARIDKTQLWREQVDEELDGVRQHYDVQAGHIKLLQANELDGYDFAMSLDERIQNVEQLTKAVPRQPQSSFGHGGGRGGEDEGYGEDVSYDQQGGAW